MNNVRVIKPFRIELFAYILSTMGIFWGAMSALRAWTFNMFVQLAFFFLIALLWYGLCMVMLTMAIQRRRYFQNKAAREAAADAVRPSGNMVIGESASVGGLGE